MNFFRENPNLLFVLRRYLDKDMLNWAEKELDQFGELCGGDFDERAVHTDREGQPRLIRYDRMGNEISEVWLNEGYKKTAEQTYNAGIVGYIHKQIPELGRKGNYIYSYAQGYLLSHTEPGFYCPVTLTMATAYLLEQFAEPAVRDRFLPHVISTGDTELYEGATFLTERQGGSDVGANETKAVKQGDHYLLYGEKYFASNAGACGMAMVLARMDDAPAGTRGLSLFAVPWRKEDGTLNNLHIRRLKDKLGVRAVPSAEVVFDGTKGYLVGDPSKGFYYMMEALNLSRVCNAIGSLGIMRRAFLEARNYAFTRVAFGKKLAEYPMIKETLVRLAAREEVELGAMFELIALFDRVMGRPDSASQEESAMNRLLIALMKMRTAEEAIDFSHEAIEMLGGNGYIEDFVTPRLLRDAQVLTVWEGAANILGLEVLRLIHKFRVHEVFISQMHSDLQQLPAEVKEFAAPVAKGLQELQGLLHHLSNQNEDAQTYHSKRVARLMGDIYTSISALKEAAVGEERKLVIARVYLNDIWGSSHIDKEMLPVRYFDLVMSPMSPQTAESAKA